MYVSKQVCIYIYVLYVCAHACTFIFVHVCMYVGMIHNGGLYVCMYVGFTVDPLLQMSRYPLLRPDVGSKTPSSMLAFGGKPSSSEGQKPDFSHR